MKKKLLASILALSLTAGLAVPAFAADTQVSGGQHEITVTTVLELPTIEVYVGAEPTMVINPYGMAFNNTALGVTGAKDTLLSAPVSITSKSTIGLDVKATPTGTAGGNATFVTSPQGVTNATGPAVYLFLNLISVESGQVDTTSGAAVIKSGADGPTWATATGTSATTVVKNGTSDTPATLKMKPAASGSSVYGGFKLIGQSGGQNWVSGDTVNVTVILTFTPDASITA